MSAATTIDLSGLGSLIKGIRNALIGTGQKGDLTELVSDETRRLAMEISRPNSKAQKKTESSIRRDIGKVFMALPAKPFSGEKRHGSGVEWLAAGPNFLLGALPEQILKSGANKSLFYRSKGKLPESRTRTVGTHGQQKVILSNRFMVSRAKIHALFTQIKKRVGIRDASFAETAQALKESKIPAASSRHFPTNKNITQLGGLANAENPTITFGSNAIGVGFLQGKVARAVKTRTRKMAHRLELILTGYAKDHNAGHAVNKRAKETAHD